MKSFFTTLIFVLCFAQMFSQQSEDFDYFKSNRDMISSGVQAILTCNGLFTSERSIEQVYDQELKYLRQPIGTARGGDYKIHWDKKAVEIGVPGGTPVMRAAYREGIGCIMLAPDQDLSAIDQLPIQTLPVLTSDAATIAWPNGDKINQKKQRGDYNQEAIDEAIRWSFERDTPEQTTISLLIVHQGEIIAEQYADGFDYTTKTRTWSTAKSIAVTLMGILSDQGKMSLDEPLNVTWLPEQSSPEQDPRNKITCLLYTSPSPRD